jgi:homoserine O-acetyltransferase/O-succinyltransferase
MPFPVKIFNYQEAFQLESGKSLPGFHLAYTALGELNAAKDNVVWVFHALTANSNAAEWWPGLIGDGQLFDPDEHFIICVNMPGSCYGSISPLDNEEFFHNFPFFTIKDMVAAYQKLKDFLGIDKIHIGIGGSMGGQQLLEWAVTEPGLFNHIIPIATNTQHSPWAIAFNASQRISIEMDESWKEKNEHAGINGMKAARSIALLSYRNYETYQLAQSENDNNGFQDFKSESYQRYQGEKLAKRFNAFSYYFLSKSMDSHNIGRGRTSIVDALKKIKAKTLVIGISSDILFPTAEQEFIAGHINGAELNIIDSTYGHDGFLLEFSQMENIIINFLKKSGVKKDAVLLNN